MANKINGLQSELNLDCIGRCFRCEFCTNMVCSLGEVNDH